MCEHQGDKDTEKVYAKLFAHEIKSTKYFINPSKLLTYNTSAHFGYGSWRGTTEILIINWQEHIRIYENLVEISYHFYGVQKRTMLENAVYPITSLLDIKNQADQFKI